MILMNINIYAVFRAISKCSFICISQRKKKFIGKIENKLNIELHIKKKNLETRRNIDSKGRDLKIYSL